ncbi:hypothetical protein [Alkalibacterium sp. 20]|uniref:hypothetical protein n=1 Tax=Alkalibacterium sp. 20 TaxID=1798803 RepID=UPI0009001599|nr:hypothetical protein [Alkalibacterium sp. 20]OJF97081.1 hypothetical protein AX762_00660 [Alkalibacterium sp. 20]
MMNKKEIVAQGYRMPKLIFKDLLLSILTLGFKRPHYTKEEAKTFVYLFEDKRIRILEESLSWDRKDVDQKILTSDSEQGEILSKGKFTVGAYVYYLDKKMIKSSENNQLN